MVRILDEIVRVDGQGRIVIPSEIRRSLGIREGGRLRLRVYGSKIVLERLSEEGLDERVEEWVNVARETEVKVSVGEPGESWKWMSHEYAKRKLGLS